MYPSSGLLNKFLSLIFSYHTFLFLSSALSKMREKRNQENVRTEQFSFCSFKYLSLMYHIVVFSAYVVNSLSCFSTANQSVKSDHTAGILHERDGDARQTFQFISPHRIPVWAWFKRYLTARKYLFKRGC